MESAQRALAAIEASGLVFGMTTHGPVHSLEEAAAARGLRPEQILKTLVVRRAAQDYLFVLIPGGRSISWPKLRTLLSVNRLSMPSADEAFEVTGYVRGTITPFGAASVLPVIADSAIATGTVSIGGGDHGVAFTVDRDDLFDALGARVADVGD